MPDKSEVTPSKTDAKAVVKPAAKAVAAVAKPAAKAVAKKPVISESMKRLAQAKSTIFKVVKQKTLAPMTTQHAHLPTGSTLVNSLIGGTKLKDGRSMCPGIPRRRVVEIYGPESSGKTTLALQTIVETQKAGGVVMFLDYEHSLHHGYAKTIGVSFDEDVMAYYQPDTMEDGLKMLYIGIMAGVDLIVVDSVAAMVPAGELAKKLDETAKVGAVAKKMSESLPKLVNWLQKYPKDGQGESAKKIEGHPGTGLILINQERATISTGGPGGGTPEPTTTGGKALKYYAYLRLRLTRISTEKIEKVDPLTGKKKKIPFGNVTQVRVVKSKIDAKQGHEAVIFIRFGYGIDDLYSIIESGAGRGVIRKDGGWYQYGEHRYNGRDKFRAALVANPTLAREITQKVSEVLASEAVPISDEELSEEDLMVQEMVSEFGEDDDSEGNAEVVEETVDVSDVLELGDDAP